MMNPYSPSKLSDGTAVGNSSLSGSSSTNASVAMANYSPISTLDRQYRNGGSGRLLLVVHCNAACCVTLQDTWKVQNDGNTFQTAITSEISMNDTVTTASMSDTTSQAESTATVAMGSSSDDDPFSFLNCNMGQITPTSPVQTAPSSPSAKKKTNFGLFLKKVAASSTKAIERGMHHLAVKADQGRTPDFLIVGLFDDRDTLLSATEAQRLPELKSSGVRFTIPLVVPAATTNGVMVLRLYVRSGAALAASRHYLVGESGPLDVAKLREAAVGRAASQATAAAALFFPVPLNSAVVLDGLMHCTAIPDPKFVTSGRGWSLADPAVNTAYRSNMFHLPLDQAYSLTVPNNMTLRSTTTTAPAGKVLLATERTVESTLVLPIAAAVTQLAATACRASVLHLQAVTQSVYEYRHDVAVGSSYAQCTVRVSHLQSNTASSSLLLNQPAMVSAMFQRPNSIFEVEVMTPARLPLHPSAAGGLRHDVSCTFYPKPVRQGIIPSVLLQLPGGQLQPNTGALLGTVRMQVTLPRRKSDTAGTVVAENPFDPVPNTQSLEETWECLIGLEEFLNSKPGETKGYIVYNVAGQSMGSLYVSITAQMIVESQPTTPSPLAGCASGGLVSLMGLQNLTDGILPVLDFEEGTLPSSINSANPEQQRRRSQLATMMHFMTHAYLEEHMNLVRILYCEALEKRALEYKHALAAAHEPLTETIPSYKDRTPRPFRPSASRTTSILSGIGFNVHIGSMSLDLIEPSPTNGTLQKMDGDMFHNITSGAPADHASGFGNVFAAKEKAANSSSTIGLKSPIGPVGGGLRRLEASRKTLAEEVSNQQTILVMFIANYFVERRNASSVAGSAVRPITHVPAGNVVLQGMRWKIFEAVQCLHHLTWICAVRRASVFSQALGIAVSSYMSSISDESKLQSTWPELWTKHGFLVSYEGLLSAAGKELGMIEDASVGIEMLRMVRITLVPDDGQVANSARVPIPHSPYLRWLHLWTSTKQGATGQEIDYFLQVGIDTAYYEKHIPTPLRNGASVRFYPILFEVGVDIFQAASNLGSNMSRSVTAKGNCEPDTQQEVLSDDDEDTVGALNDDVLVQLNYEAFQKMNAYAQAVSPALPVQATPTHQTHPLLSTLFQHISSSAGKMNHDILVEASGKAQALGGGACVFCKSGKDRTAMHVTYKQAQFATRFRQNKPGVPETSEALLGASEGLADSTLEDAMLFRLYGTRLPICEKNVGQAKYAFNSLQTKFMPDALKPPATALAGFLKGGKVFGGGGIES